MITLLGRLDQAVYRVERFIVVAGLFTMSGVVFVDVVHRTFADPESKVAKWMAAGLGLFGSPELSGSLYPTMRDWVTPPLLFLFFVILSYIGVRWRAKAARTTRWRAWGVALGLTLLGWIAIRGMIFLLPNGLVWAQTLALVLTLWVGFTGASMCTFDGRHLRVEVADRLWPASTKRVVGVLANAFTASMVLALFILSLYFVESAYAMYVQTEGHGGVFEGLPILPHWVAYAILPFTFLVMGLRFVAAAVAAGLGRTYGRVGGDPIQAMLKEASEGVTVLSDAHSDSDSDSDSDPEDAS